MAKTRTEIFGENLKKIVKQKSVTRLQLAELLGVSLTAINSYINGRKQPPLEKIFILADFLEVSVMDLIGNNGYTPEDISGEKQIFQYRLQRALKLVNRAGIEIETYSNGLVISIPSTTEIVNENGTTETIFVTNAYRVKDNADLVNIVELSESQSIQQSKLFIEVFENKLNPAT